MNCVFDSMRTLSNGGACISYANNPLALNGYRYNCDCPIGLFEANQNKVFINGLSFADFD